MNKTPVRLAKTENKTDDVLKTFYHSFMNRIEAWVLSHAFICLIVLLCLLMAFFVALIFAVTGVSATESGIQYNGLERII